MDNRRYFEGLDALVARCLRDAGAPAFDVADVAPDRVADVVATWSARRSLRVWSGGTSSAIYPDPASNYAFRAWHDFLHISTGLGFTVADEMRLADVQAAHAARVVGDRFADVVWCEIAAQAIYFGHFGRFVADQSAFTRRAIAARARFGRAARGASFGLPDTPTAARGW